MMMMVQYSWFISEELIHIPTALNRTLQLVSSLSRLKVVASHVFRSDSHVRGALK